MMVNLLTSECFVNKLYTFEWKSNFIDFTLVTKNENEENKLFLVNYIHI